MMLHSLLGFWNGTTKTTAFLHYTQLEIFQPKEDSESLQLRLLTRTQEEFPEAELEWTSARTFTCKLPHPVLAAGTALNGCWSASGQILTVKFYGSIFDIENYEVKLRKDNPTCRKYQRAAPSLDYEYRVPEQISDPDFESGDAAEHGLSTADITSMVKRLLRLNSGKKNDAQVDGILILKDGKLVLEEYFWGLSEDDHHEISSCTKSITSLLFGIAWDQGLIDLEEPVTEIFPEVDSSWSKEEPIRLKHILSMTSGTAFDDDLDEDLLRSDNVPAFVLNAKQIAAPGSTYAYDNSLPILAGLILERKTGTTVTSFAQKHLFNPLHIQNPQWSYLPNQKAHDGSRMALTTGALHIPLRDFSKIGQLVLNKGVFAGQQIVSNAWLEQSTSQHTLEGQWPYGFYWHLSNGSLRHVHGFDAVMAIGQAEQICLVVPELNMVVAWMSSTWVNNFGYRVGLRLIDEEFVSKIRSRKTDG